MLKDVQMRLDSDGKVEWTFSPSGGRQSPYRIKIERLTDETETTRMGGTSAKGSGGFKRSFRHSSNVRGKENPFAKDVDQTIDLILLPTFEMDRAFPMSQTMTRPATP